MKFENSARLFLNGDIGEESSWHGDLNIIYDAKGVNNDYRGHEIYTQYDWLRELFIDTNAGGWDFRIGKQQQVWGTADGIKLLDIINPTDFRELNQAPQEDSRIPVWMIAAERNVGENGNVQAIVSQAESNKIAGLSTIGDGETRAVGYNDPMGFSGTVIPSDNSQLTSTDHEHPFILKGVDTISGGVNGFFSIGAAMGAVTTTFRGQDPQTFTNPLGGANPNQPEFNTVGGFTALPAGFNPASCGPASGAGCLESFTELTNQNVTNLIDVTDPISGAGWDTTNPNSMWEYMPSATFATFNTYVGMTTQYKRLHDDDVDANFGVRFRNTLDNGLNFGVNYLYAYDPNPVVNIHWEDPNTGERLVVNEYFTDPTVTAAPPTNVVQLSNAAGTKFYGATATYTPGIYTAAGTPTDVTAANLAGAPVLVFEEDLTRVHNIGASFDYAFDTDFAPIVLRGEFLYQKDIHQPVIDRDALGRGNLTEALKTMESDFFKYVIGVDVTVLTNMMVSGQFIQFRNLDFVDEQKSCTYFDPLANAHTYDCSRYTADPATMHITNGMQKGWKNKEFISLFFSKPFGESQEHRWNNITIYEEGDGWWNRFDVEYSFTDELIGTAEWNQYWGDEDTTFGQFEKSSNLQVGIKYIFE